MPSSLASHMRVLRGDITRLAVDAIVNAANESLLPGGGVCGAIHRAAGPELEAECQKIRSCPTGQARITKGYKLPARHVIHAVGPVWHGGSAGEEDLLRSCYRGCLELEVAHKLRSIAFPCISTGIFGYPKERACAVAVSTVAEWLRNHDLPAEVFLCCFGDDDLRLYEVELARLA